MYLIFISLFNSLIFWNYLPLLSLNYRHLLLSSQLLSNFFYYPIMKHYQPSVLMWNDKPTFSFLDFFLFFFLRSFLSFFSQVSSFSDQTSLLFFFQLDLINLLMDSTRIHNLIYFDKPTAKINNFYLELLSRIWRLSFYLSLKSTDSRLLLFRSSQSLLRQIFDIYYPLLIR